MDLPLGAALALALVLLMSSRRALEDSDEAEGLGSVAGAFAVAAGARVDASADFCFGGGAKGTSVVDGCGGAEVELGASTAPAEPLPLHPGCPPLDEVG